MGAEVSETTGAAVEPVNAEPSHAGGAGGDGQPAGLWAKETVVDRNLMGMGAGANRERGPEPLDGQRTGDGAADPSQNAEAVNAEPSHAGGAGGDGQPAAGADQGAAQFVELDLGGGEIVKVDPRVADRMRNLHKLNGQLSHQVGELRRGKVSGTDTDEHGRTRTSTDGHGPERAETPQSAPVFEVDEAATLAAVEKAYAEGTTLDVLKAGAPVLAREIAPTIMPVVSRVVAEAVNSILGRFTEELGPTLAPAFEVANRIEEAERPQREMAEFQGELAFSGVDQTGWEPGDYTAAQAVAARDMQGAVGRFQSQFGREPSEFELGRLMSLALYGAGAAVNQHRADAKAKAEAAAAQAAGQPRNDRGQFAGGAPANQPGNPNPAMRIPQTRTVSTPGAPAPVGVRSSNRAETDRNLRF